MSTIKSQVEFENYKSYNGNPLLKRSAVNIKWTPDTVSEYIKCSQDPIYFCENYMKIVNVDKGLIPFKLYDYQKTMVNTMANDNRVVLTTSRQAGKCVHINTPIRLKNKKTGEIIETTVGEFYESQKKQMSYL